jgi:hypothetical protein
MRNLKCKVYDDCIIEKGMTKHMREICKLVNIEISEKILLPTKGLEQETSKDSR